MNRIKGAIIKNEPKKWRILCGSKPNLLILTAPIQIIGSNPLLFVPNKLFARKWFQKWFLYAFIYAIVQNATQFARTHPACKLKPANTILFVEWSQLQIVLNFLYVTN